MKGIQGREATLGEETDRKPSTVEYGWGGHVHFRPRGCPMRNKTKGGKNRKKGF